MKLSLGFSTCPNDTFIFDALVHQRLTDTSTDWEIQLGDVEELNQLARKSLLDVTKMSYRAFFDVREEYYLLRSGGALGRGCGPLLIGKTALSLEAINHGTIAIPGAGTTANFLLEYAFPNAQKKEALLFSEIEQAVLDGRYLAGLIIHENRFTYQEKGLVKLADLGEVWEHETQSPIPLGCIVCKKSVGREKAKQIEAQIRESVEFAFQHRELSSPYIQAHAQEMNPAVLQAHIDLYVNEFSLDIGEEGVRAIQKMGQIITKDAEFDATTLFP